MPEENTSNDDSLVNEDGADKDKEGEEEVADEEEARLGKYTIPGSDKWGASDAMRGEGQYGLQQDFYDYCQKLIDDSNDEGNGTLLMGVNGYVSKSQAANRAKNGNKGYQSNLKYFGTGLAWEIHGMSSKAKSFVQKSAKKYGLKLMRTTVASINQASETKTSSSAPGLIPEGDDARSRLASINQTLDKNRQEADLMSDRAIQNAAASNTVMEFLVPMSVTVDKDADGVEYDGDAGGGGEYSSEGGGSVVQAAYFVANQFRNLEADAMSELLTGERAIANDVTLWSSVQSALAASMRACCSAPDGSFIAWYPDYWGINNLKGNSHDSPFLTLEDIELVNLTVSQSDDEFYSHVFTAGVDLNGAQDPFKLLYTIGVVSIESDAAAKAASEGEGTPQEGGEGQFAEPSSVPAAILKNLIYIPEGEEWKYSPKELYRRYGARPMVASKAAHLGAMSSVIDLDVAQEQESDKSAETTDSGEKADKDESDESTSTENDPKYIMPFLCALYEFMEHWANQYKATLEMTFMPELFPGCRIKVKSFDISFYVQSVTHNISYESGFTTTAKCICPIGSLVSGMVQPKVPDSNDATASAGGD